MKKLKCCYGISSRCDTHEHIFMIDYDGITLEEVKKHLKFVQEDYKLSDIYIMSSTHGFNAICLDKLPLSIIYNIGISVFSPACRDFFKYGFKREYYVLRFDNDKDLVCILPGNGIRDKSTPHKEFLEMFFNFKIKGENFDENKILTVIQYPSKKNGYHIIEKMEHYVYDKRQI